MSSEWDFGAMDVDFFPVVVAEKQRQNETATLNEQIKQHRAEQKGKEGIPKHGLRRLLRTLEKMQPPTPMPFGPNQIDREGTTDGRVPVILQNPSGAQAPADPPLPAKAPDTATRSSVSGGGGGGGGGGPVGVVTGGGGGGGTDSCLICAVAAAGLALAIS